MYEPVARMPADEHNPYAAPAAARAAHYGEPAAAARLADRATRLAAVLINGVLAALAFFAGCVIAVLLVGGWHDDTYGSDADVLLAMLIACSGILSLGIVQAYLLTRDGQSIGRKLLRIKIVRHDHGGRAGFARVVLVREIVNGLIGSIPFVSYVYALVDSLFIFGHERRCLHDYLAGTKVVTAASPRRRYRRPAETPAARGSRPAASSTVSHAAPSD